MMTMIKKALNTGYVKFWRKIWDNPIGNKPVYLAIFLYIISHANFKDKDIIWNNKKITIKRGSFIGSMSQIAKCFGISVGTVSYILDYLISERMIEKQSNFKFTVFTVKNYDYYQSTESKLKTGDRHNGVINNEKSEKRVEKQSKHEPTEFTAKTYGQSQFTESSSESELKASKKQAETTNNDKKEEKDNNNNSVVNKFVDKVISWAYGRSPNRPSCSKEAYRGLVVGAVDRFGIDQVKKLFVNQTNAIQFLVDIKGLTNKN